MPTLPDVLVLYSIIVAWVTYGTYRIDSEWSWRLPTLFQGLPAIVNLAALYFTPESPRWLIGKDRSDEARAILIKYHANGDESSSFINAEYEEIHATLKIEMTGTRSWSELIKTKTNRHRTFLILCCAFFPQWSGNGLVVYFKNLAPGIQSALTLL